MNASHGVKASHVNSSHGGVKASRVNASRGGVNPSHVKASHGAARILPDIKSFSGTHSVIDLSDGPT